MPAGRPLLFQTEEELHSKIREYLDSVIVKEDQPTITGLAYYLGFESRQSFYDYEAKEQFSYTIKRARLLIEANYEQALFSKNPTGPIFALKNFGWRDKQEIDQKHSGGISVNWAEPNVQHPDDKGGPGELQGLQGGLPDNS